MSMSSAFGRFVSGLAGLGLAYLTAVFIAFTSWTTADTSAGWVQGNVPLLGAAAVSGVTTAWLLLFALLGRRPPIDAVVASGVAPTVVTLLTAPLRY
jgi:hypothetical protein